MFRCKYGACLLLLIWFASSIPVQAEEPVGIKHFVTLVTGTPKEQLAAMDVIGEQWSEEYSANYVAMILESLSFSRSQRIYFALHRLIGNNTKQNFKLNSNTWFQWVWSQPYHPHPEYSSFKSQIYRHVDPVFAEYFDKQPKASIRLDEIRWGGVKQDGIPPLRKPKMISADAADYLADTDIVFGVEVNGDVRAYPKRILAWHEMFVDTLGGEAVAGVYCTLCGTLIIYDTKIKDKIYAIGTSGFLYRSNKLMYDKETQSLWSTFSGSPVVGSLVGKGIKFQHRYVVTTTWGEWKARHPQSQVLSLNTGYKRNYDEGIAYKDYFATDRLMFAVPTLDRRLKNKAEVLGIILNEYPNKPLAISVEYLAKNQVYHGRIENQTFVALTDKSGAIRVYENNGLKFIKWDKQTRLVDEGGMKWTLTESKLTNRHGAELYRLPANRAFWFGWYSAYSHTQLVK